MTLNDEKENFKTIDQKVNSDETSVEENADGSMFDIFTNEPDSPIQQIIKKKNTKYRYTKLSNFVLKFSRFYAPMPIYKIALFTAFFAIIFGVVGIFFVKNPGIYNFGLAAIGQAISRLTNVLLRSNPEITVTIYNIIDQALFWILYLILSIPIFWFGLKKVGKTYTWLTLEFLVISSLVSFALGQIPNIGNVNIFGDFTTASLSDNFKNAIAQDLWYGKTLIWQLIPLQWNDGGAIVAQIIFAVVYGIILAFFFAIIAIMGGGAGVTGIIGEYMSTVKHKNFGTINSYINIVIMIISVLIGTYIAGSLVLNDLSKLVDNYNKNGLNSLPENIRNAFSSSNLDGLTKLAKNEWNTTLYFSPNMISTFICNFVFAAALNSLFPRYKVIQLKIFSPHMSAIRKVIVEDKKTINSFTISKGIGGYSGHEMKVLTAITLYKQVPRLIKKIRQIDQNSLITINNIAAVDGNIYIPESKF
ncbi:hypothetical protein MM26B8_04490 [Mycoplasmopsis meleagridis]|uniref:DUF2179 domain-containing protein n=1 Tax=Mycoplasmopsis meleagridis ATCC 25294 TaxID=1264554 RepID=A0A0F5H0L5_9BACT|nr:DUF2179 domain-containing protein [Mycoplasmopsis meleagridis]KKB26743.1 hypothetical protein MMELEA_01260 [Mycoplasmopsis meleagridis ATCC 25294]OAD18141.1 hypothetical protein MM26B8_04490 [Mycoplasmopsis meleagridis]VEU77277.1 Uncharacterized BCR, YitT family COG1284 [Mycoplasmopsis meleagridis]